VKVEFSELAEEQFREAQAACRDSSPERAKRFAAEVRKVVRRIGRYPEVGHAINGTRRMILRRFPYSLLYEISEGKVYITKLLNQKQEPDYWADDQEECDHSP
jgi:toxin ParE1/3/4